MIEIKIRPQAKQSVRGGRHFYTDPKKKAYVNELKKLFSEEIKEKISGNVKLEISFFYKVPKSWSKRKQSLMLGNYKGSKADLDNLSKPVLDSLNGIAYDDDSSVVDLRLQKYWGEYDSICVFISGC